MSDWMTYAEAAARFGVSSEAVRQIAIRRKWPRRKQNDPLGRVQVLIPDDAEFRSRTPVEPTSERPFERPADTRSSIALDALREAIGALREQLQAERARTGMAEAGMAALRVQIDQLKHGLRDAEAGLTAERAAKATVEAEAEELRQAANHARAEAHEAAQAAVEAETTRLRQASGQAVEDAETLRQELARLTAQAAEPRPAMVASKIDEVQLRRLQEAEQARKSLGRLARLKAAWRGE